VTVSRKAVQAVQYPTCVRHMKSRKDVRLRHFFLCDGCTDMWTAEAFHDNKPLASLEPIQGYCGLCNKSRTVRLQTWFLCDICDRVARSIGRNHVAEDAILKYWKQNVVQRFPHLVIVQNDKSSLRPRQDTDESGQGPLDFLVTDKREGKVVFGIENKTGRSSIREMSQFQLDVSDCDAILNHVRQLRVPAFVIHAQVLELWAPTVGYHTIGLWWTDIYRMAGNFAGVKMRALERRGAAYFKKAAFSPMETFLDALYDDHGRLAIAAKFAEEGIPSLYVVE